MGAEGGAAGIGRIPRARMGLAARLACAALATLLLAACTMAGFRSHGWASPPRLDAPDYYAELERATWYESIYVGLDLRAFLAITWDSPALLAEQARALEALGALPVTDPAFGAGEEAEEAQEGDPDEPSLDFLLSLFTARRAWNDLQAKDSIWTVELLTPEGEGVVPLSIERIARPDANLIALYPYINRFAVTYRIRFPRRDAEGRALAGPGVGSLRLRLVSAVGRSEPRWKLEAGGRIGTAR